MKQNHTEHPIDLPRYSGTLQELAEDIADMRYDSLAAFVEHLADKIHADADNDLEHGRRQLASKLYKLADDLYEARNDSVELWEFCRKFMES